MDLGVAKSAHKPSPRLREFQVWNGLENPNPMAPLFVISQLHSQRGWIHSESMYIYIYIFIYIYMCVFAEKKHGTGENEAR